MEVPIAFSDFHFTLLLTQGNVHSLSILNLCSGMSEILVASLKKKVCLIAFSENAEKAVIPLVKDVSFSNIPNAAEIVAVDSFNRSNDRDDFRIGFVVCKGNAVEDNIESYLNIYSEQDKVQVGHILNIDSIAQNCSVIELNYLVHHFTHALSVTDPADSKSREIVWICSGFDMKLHVYQEDYNSHTFSEVAVKEVFPELTNLPNHTVVFWLQIEYLQNFTRRASVLSCVSGSIYVYIADIVKNSVETYIDMSHHQISRVDFFSVRAHPLENNEITNVDELQESDSMNFQDFHLLVVNANEEAVVYRNVAEEGFTNREVLNDPSGEIHETYLCACVADINMDGLNEIMIGTYDRKILIFKVNDSGWEFSSELPAASPVHSLAYVDVTSDGVKELVIHTLSGVLVMQHKPDRVKQILLSRFSSLEKSESSEEDK